MTSGGIFTLIANDGKADNLIYATKLLNTRIAQIKQQNQAGGAEDSSPTLSEIERTHMLFVNAHFKPFVMIGFEYMKSRPTTAGMKLNTDSTSLLKYNIPQFGDFFSDMALNARIKNIKDDGRYKYKSVNGNGPTWKLCTKLANGDVHVNFAVSANGSATGTNVSASYKDGNEYSYKVYNKPAKTMSFMSEANGEYAVDETKISVSDMAVLAMTCFVENPDSLGVSVEGKKVYPFVIPDSDWPTAGPNGSVAATTTVNTSSVSTGWANVENIVAARGYVCKGGVTSAIITDLTGSTANIRQAPGYLYYYGAVDEASVTVGTSVTTTSAINTKATANNQLEVKTASGLSGFDSNMYVEIEYNEGYVDSDGQNVPSGVEFAAGSKYAKQLRFSEFPGHRLIRDVKFTVNNNILDQYNQEVYNMYEKFYMKSEKKTGYYKLVGQQLPIKGKGEETSAGAQVVTDIVDGNQVPTSDMSGNHFFWIPLLFWFSKDFRLSIPSVSIPFGQRNIDVTLSPLKDLVSTVPAKVFKVSKQQINFSRKTEQDKNVLYYGGGADMGQYTGSLDVYNSRNEIKVNTFRAQVTNDDYDTSVKGDIISNDEIDIDLYINNLFVTPEIHDIFIKRVGFNLIRVHVQQEISLTAQNNEILLSSLKWPIEYMLVGVKPNSNRADPDNYHKYETVQKKQLPQTFSGSNGNSVNYINYDKTSPILESFGIKAHGVSLYDDTFTSKFYNAYLPYKYGADIVTPQDDGVYMINFCLYPGDYQPSGHINVSRAREFYFKYNTVSSFNPAVENATLYIIASAINFLLISDGSAVLRYTT